VIAGESAAYKRPMMEVDGDLKPLTDSCKQFPMVSDLAVRYLSVPGNSADTEQSVGKYTDRLSVYLLYINVSAPIASYKSCLSSYDGDKR